MSGAVFTLGNSVSGSLSLGSALSKFGRVAGQAGFTIEQEEETLNNTVTSRYAGLAAVTVSGVTSVLNPSLVLIPSAYNTSGSTGILYSLHSKPNGVADFVVTRATEGTRFNSVGRISTVGSGDARLDYLTSGGTAGTPALLVEPSAQNLAWHSHLWVSGTNWLNSEITVVTGTSGTIDPFGTNLANAISPTSGSSSHIAQSNSPTTISYTSGTIYNQSAFFKQGTGNAGRYIQLTMPSAAFSQLGYANFDLQLGTVAVVSGTSADTNRAARIENYGNGWYRCQLTATANVTAGGAGVGAVLATASGSIRAASFSGTVTDVIYGFGAQLEVGSVATSYIPTTTAAITRNADVISVTGAVSGCIGQSEGTIYWEGAINRIDRVFFALASGASTTQNIRLQGSSTGLMQFVVQSGTIQANIGTSGAITLGQFYKVAVAYKQDDFVFYVNGQKVGEDNSGTIPTNLNSVYFLNPNGTEITDQRCRAVALYTTRLTNAELAAMTQL